MTREWNRTVNVFEQDDQEMSRQVIANVQSFGKRTLRGIPISPHQRTLIGGFIGKLKDVDLQNVELVQKYAKGLQSYISQVESDWVTTRLAGEALEDARPRHDAFIRDLDSLEIVVQLTGKSEELASKFPGIKERFTASWEKYICATVLLRHGQAGRSLRFLQESRSEFTRLYSNLIEMQTEHPTNPLNGTRAPIIIRRFVFGSLSLFAGLTQDLQGRLEDRLDGIMSEDDEN